MFKRRVLVNQGVISTRFPVSGRPNHGDGIFWRTHMEPATVETDLGTKNEAVHFVMLRRTRDRVGPMPKKLAEAVADAINREFRAAELAILEAAERVTK